MGGLCSKSDTHGNPPPAQGAGSSGGPNGFVRGGNMLPNPRHASGRGYISPLESIGSGRNSSRIVSRDTPKQSGHISRDPPRQSSNNFRELPRGHNFRDTPRPSGHVATTYPHTMSMLPPIEDSEPEIARLESFDRLSKQGTRMSDKCSRVSVSNVKLGTSTPRDSRPSTNFSKPEYDNEIDVYTRMGLVKNQPQRPYSELILRNKTFVVRDGNGALKRPSTDTLNMPMYRASHISVD